MDEFQATPPEELQRLRSLAWDRFGPLFLEEAMQRLAAERGEEALEELRTFLAEKVESSDDAEAPQFRKVKDLAIERLSSVLNQVRGAPAVGERA